MSQLPRSGSEGRVVVAKPRSTPEGPEPDERKGTFAFLRELPVLIILALGLALLIKSFLVQAFYIPSQSMQPTLEIGDRVLVNKVVYRLRDARRGDIIVFEDPNPEAEPDRGIVGGFVSWLSEGLGLSRSPEEDFIKRIVGLPGETVEAKGGRVFVDGEAIPEPYLEVERTDDFGPVVVPDGELFVMGDFRSNSNDSRFGLGTVPVERVIGKAFVVIWPPSRIGWL